LSNLATVKRQDGAAIRTIRKAQNIKLREMARRIEVDAGFLCHVEAERCYASQRTLDSLARELRVPVSKLMKQPVGTPQ